MTKPAKKTAILLTCFNRIASTLACLQNLKNAKLPNGYMLDIFLVDDGSTDGTGNSVRKKFPEVTVINGTGNLFWSGGMRLAWETAASTNDYDFYIWLNDDTHLNKYSIVNIFKDYNAVGKPSVITASCKQPDSDNVSYGGRTEKQILYPNGKPQECKYINGNFTLIPKEIYQSIGQISKAYTHALGDFDYGLRVQKAGFKCYTTSTFLAECKTNPTPKWCSPNSSLITRVKLLNSPVGINFKEYMYYRKSNFGIASAVVSFFKLAIRIISPRTYDKLCA